MVSTIKFSEFDVEALNNANAEVVGLESGVNVRSTRFLTWTTAGRPPSPFNGLMGLNTTLQQYEYWDAPTSTWAQFDSSIIGGIDSLSAATGITLTPNPITVNGTVGLTIPVLVTSGGTGSTTASGARTNLGAAASGANSDITSLNGITGIIKAPTFISSSANNPILSFTYIPSAINYVGLLNNTSGSPPAIIAIGGDSNINLQLNGKGTGGVDIYGVSTNSSAPNGAVGQLVSSIISSGSAVSLVTTVSANVTSISLDAGDWDVWGNVAFLVSSSANVVNAWSSSTSATLPDASLVNFDSNLSASGGGISIPQRTYQLASTTTIYLSAQANFGAGTVSACGGIYARRVR